jgi:hypothetical protein
MQYGLLLQIHSLVRWLVLAGLLLPLIQSYSGLLWPRPFSKYDRRVVVLGTMAAHTQLLAGLTLYMSSPFVALFWSGPGEGAANRQLLFFSVIHIFGMAASVVLMSVGSSLAKRATEDRQKFRLIATYWTIAAVVILLLIPWPISPLAQRPLWRPF